MGWEDKYRIEAQSNYPVLLQWKMLIQEDSFAGDVTDIIATGEPIDIDHDNESDNYNDPIRVSKAIANVWSQVNFSLLNLYSDEDRHFRVLVYYGAVLYWTGYVNSGEFSEPYDDVPYPVTISANCGLNDLKTIKYDDDGTPYNGRILTSQIILDILAKIGYTDFAEFINIYEGSMVSTVDDSFFDQTKIDVDVFEDMYCYDVLTEILKDYNACITMFRMTGQDAPRFQIWRPKELVKSTVYGRIFTAATTKTSTSFSPDQFINRVPHATNRLQVPGGKLMIKKPVKKVTINQDYGYKGSWIENWKFESSKFYKNPILWDAENWTRVDMLGPGISPILQGGIIAGSDGVAILEHNAYPALNKYIYQEFGTYIVQGAADVFVFEFEYQWINERGASAASQSFFFSVEYNDASHWLHEDDASFCSWVASNIMDITEDVADGNSDWKIWSRKFTGLPHAGTYIVKFYALNNPGAYDIFIAVKNVGFYSTSDVIRTYVKSVWKFPWIIRSWSLKRKTTRTYVDKIEITENKYIVTNAINGQELEFDYILGDVVGSGIDNVLEQFAGSLARYDSLATIAAAFDTDHSADYTPGGVNVTHSGNDIIFTAIVAGVNFSGNTTITNTDGDLAGNVVHTQANVTGQNRIDTVTLTGTEGEILITLDEGAGVFSEYCVWNTDLSTTASAFVTAYAGVLAALGITLTSVGAVLYFTGTPDFLGALIVEDWITDLHGELSEGTYIPSVARIDTITLTGTSGTADILCDGVTEEAAFGISPTTDWNTRGGAESKPLLEIAGDEIALQHRRPKQLIQMPIVDKDAAAPCINILGNFQDDLNIDDSDFLVKVVAGWTPTDCTLALAGGYARYTSTAVDSNIWKDNTDIDGSEKNLLSIKYKVISGTSGYGQIYYRTSGHTRSAGYYKDFYLIEDGEWHILQIDMSDLTAGGTDWVTNIITELWVDIRDNDDVIIDIDWIGFNRKFVFNRGSFAVKENSWNIDLCEIIS